jgi:hypothetical protein
MDPKFGISDTRLCSTKDERLPMIVSIPDIRKRAAGILHTIFFNLTIPYGYYVDGLMLTEFINFKRGD